MKSLKISVKIKISETKANTKLNFSDIIGAVGIIAGVIGIIVTIMG